MLLGRESIRIFSRGIVEIVRISRIIKDYILFLLAKLSPGIIPARDISNALSRWRAARLDDTNFI